MRREAEQQIRGSGADVELARDEEHATDTSQFSAAGSIPEVVAFGTPAASASERAFGGDDLLARLPADVAAVIADATAEQLGALLDAHADVADPIMAATQQLRGAAFAQQVVATRNRLHKPVPAAEQGTSTQAPSPAPAPSPKTSDPQRAKHWARAKSAAWMQLTLGVPDERTTVDEVRLPDNIAKELDRAWRDSFVGTKSREQGGNLVRNDDGSYEIRRQPNESSRFFDQDDNDVGDDQKLVAQVHTHPYSDFKKQVPEQFASFSEGDFDSLMRSDAHMAVLRSGPYTFMLSKTKQFNAIVDRFNNDEEKLRELAKQMHDTYNKAFDRTEGWFSQKVEAGVLAVCEQFHLLYFVGQGADMVRKSKQRT